MTNSGYNLEFYKGLSGAREHNERALWGVFAHLGRPASFLDMGCGDGWLVYTVRGAGVTVATGVEVSEDAIKVAPPGTDIAIYDLSQPMFLAHRYELVISWEVGEHLPEEAADTYVNNLARHVGRYLVFTAAAVGQGGFQHVNCQDQEYWRSKLERRELVYNQERTSWLRETWRYTVGPLIYLPNNLQVFERA